MEEVSTGPSRLAFHADYVTVTPLQSAFLLELCVGVACLAILLFAIYKVDSINAICLFARSYFVNPPTFNSYGAILL